MRELWFHRDFLGYSGGHGKVFDYFQHAAAHPAFFPRIHFTPASVDHDNPWRRAAVPTENEWRPDDADALFLGGMDWAAVPSDVPGRPIINLVQHVRHADPAGPLYAFLSRRAIRICVSRPVADAITATRRVVGPVLVIEAGLALAPCPPAAKTMARRVFIAAAKQPALGAALAERLDQLDYDVDLCVRWTDRDAFLHRLAEAERAVMLPFATEGFFLPGLEAMALGTPAVVPDCVGNRDYLMPGDNALSPAMELDAMVAAVRDLDAAALRDRLVAQGHITAARFSASRERRAFHTVLDQLDALWTA